MANQTRRLTPEVLAADEAVFAALQAMSLYDPANHAYTLSAINTAHGLLLSARMEEAQAQVALDTARDVVVGRGWEFHNLILGAKDQVVAQFGRDSNEAQAVKLTKTSERKSPQRKRTGGETNS